jgi:hypothetical protein
MYERNEPSPSATLDGHIGIVADEHIRNGNGYIARVNAEGPLGARRKAGKTHTPMGLKVLRTARNAMPAQVLGTGANNTAHPCERYRHKRRIIRLRNANGGIKTLLDEVHNSINEQKFDAHVGIAPHELVHDG